MNDTDIIQNALTRLTGQEGLEVTFKVGKHNLEDGEIELHYKGKNLKTFVEVKRNLQLYQLPEILDKFRHTHPLMIVAEKASG